MTYDNNGNVLTASGVTYTYNAVNRMLTSTSSSLTTNYLINFLGQRTKKSNTSSTTWFIYDENDNIIAEYDGSGNVQNEYVYLDNRPVGLIRSSSLYYIYSDHLQTPRAITDTSNNLKWTWENKESFGNNAPNETISGSTFKFNMRFSGQYFDNETNLNYNLHRDYNPVWGRYIESDPLGLSAGISTYIYVGGNGLKERDKDGLMPTEDYLKKWICDSNSRLDALNKARDKKMSEFDVNDPMDADNRNAAEHYIFARYIAHGDQGFVYLMTGSYWGFYYQGAKKAGFYPHASPPSYMQLYWEEKAYTDAIHLTHVFQGNINSQDCGCERK